MPGRPHIFTAVSSVDVPESAINTETVVATLSGVTAEFPGQQVFIQGLLTILAGTTTTGITLRVRRSTLVGTLVNEANAETGDVVASKETTLPFFAQDAPGEVTGAVYVITMQSAGAGTVANCAASVVNAVVQ